MIEKRDTLSLSGRETDEVQKKRKSHGGVVKEPVHASPETISSPLDPQATLRAAEIAASFEQQHAAEKTARQAIEESQKISEAEAEILFNQYLDSQVNTILPKLPDNDPVWRYCWVTTDTSLGGDNVQTRLRGGWILAKWGEVPGLMPDVMNNRSATSGDIITFNELAVMKIPRLVWEKIMTYNHHTAPLEQEAAVKAKIQAMVGDRSKAHHAEYVSPDVQNYGKSSKKANFTGI